jgi:protein-tyrosine phosphatase
LTADKVIERLYIADWQEARDASAPNLVKVTVAEDSPFVGDYYFPIVDADDPDNKKALGDAIQKVSELMEQDSVVLVHCVSGISRSCVVIMGYLNRKKGLPLDEAFELVRRARSAVQPEPDLLDLLK